MNQQTPAGGSGATGLPAARRRLPMVEVDPSTPLTGPRGPVTLLEAFEGRRQLIAYYFMWNPEHPAAEQCEGCTFYNGRSASSLRCILGTSRMPPSGQGPQEESVRYRELTGWDMPWYSAHASLGALLAGRQTGCSASCATYGTAAASSKPTGRPAAAPRQWTTATPSWTPPSTDARSRGKTHPRLATTVLQHAHRRRPARLAASLCSGRAGAHRPVVAMKPAALTTSPSAATAVRTTQRPRRRRRLGGKIT